MPGKDLIVSLFIPLVFTWIYILGKTYKGGNLQLVHGTRMFLNNSTYTIEPKVGDFYFFPNYMMHVVYPFKDTNEERRSISFNAKIDDNIFNIYG